MSRSPLMECDRPSADSAMNKFISAMPSSMCWPVGEKSQLKVEGMRSLLNVSAKTSRANRPRRLTHEPRLVDTVTSGDVVTMQAAFAIAGKRHAIEERLDFFRRPPKTLERIPFMAGTDVHRRPEYFGLRRRHQAGVIVLVPGERQTVALDRVGDEADRAIVIDGVECGDDRRQIVGAEIVH